MPIANIKQVGKMRLFLNYNIRELNINGKDQTCQCNVLWL